MTDCTGLTGDTAAGNVGNDVVLAYGFGNAEGLIDNQLQGFQTKIIINVSAVDGNLTGTGQQSYSCNGFFSSSSAVI